MLYFCQDAITMKQTQAEIRKNLKVFDYQQMVQGVVDGPHASVGQPLPPEEEAAFSASMATQKVVTANTTTTTTQQMVTTPAMPMMQPGQMMPQGQMPM